MARIRIKWLNLSVQNLVFDFLAPNCVFCFGLFQISTSLTAHQQSHPEFERRFKLIMSLSSVKPAITALLRPFSTDHRLKSKFFQNAPPELLELILELLPTKDQICFSLTCKFCFAWFQSYVKRRGTTVAQLLPKKKACAQQGIVLSTSEFTTPDQARSHLLCRLQNNRWKYCCQCQSLHPHSMRRALESRWRLTQKPCGFDCHLSGTSLLGKDLDFPNLSGPRVECSLAYTGEVDICPCDGMTFHQRQHFYQFCQLPSTAIRYRDRGYMSKHFNGGKLDTICHYLELSHECTLVKPFVGKVFTKTRIWLDRETQNLHLHNRLRFELCERSQDVKHGGCFPYCLHRDTGRWLQDFFIQTEQKFYTGVQGTTTSVCKWRGWCKTQEGRTVFEIDLDRNLGGNEWPNKSWRLNSYLK
jgi:hypothetical protein